jgi:Na+/H+-dicarboxylate symporter
LHHVVKEYWLASIIIISTRIFYLLLLFGVASNFSLSRILQIIKNYMPALIVGFTAMSSTAAMPLTIKATEDSLTTNKASGRFFIPLTMNIHLVGDGIFIPTMAFVVMKTFGFNLPDFGSYLIFAFYFVLAKFASAGVPGGGIMVMLPVLEKHFGMNPDMLSLITSLYIMFDPLITTINISGNGALSIIYSNFLNIRDKSAQQIITPLRE